MSNLDGYKPKMDYNKLLLEYIETMDEEEATLKVLDKKEKELESILFLAAPYLTKHKRGPMDMFLKRQ